MQTALASSSLTQTAYERLRADLLGCRLRPGDRLKINELCLRLGVSLSAVREALSRLTSEGLVTAEPQRGFRVAPISVAELHDLTAVRIDIESQCLRRSIAVGDLAWESQLVASYHALSRTELGVPGAPERMDDQWSAAHAAYHAALAASCDSAWLLRLRHLLFAQSERYRRLSVPLAERNRDLNAEHREIMELALARDAKGAVRALAAHLRATTDGLLHSSATPLEP